MCREPGTAQFGDASLAAATGCRSKDAGGGCLPGGEIGARRRMQRISHEQLRCAPKIMELANGSFERSLVADGDAARQ